MSDIAAIVEPPVSDGARGTGARKRWVGTVARVGISVAALAVVFSRVPVGDVARAIGALDPPWVLGAFAAVFAAIGVSALKWKLLLSARGRSLGLQRLTRHYFVGLFFNNFLPTSVGGDVVRAWDAGKDLGDAPDGAASVIAERLIASLALGLTAGLGLMFVSVGREAIVAVALLVLVSAGLVVAFLAPSRSERMMSSAMGGRFEGVAGGVSRAVVGVRETLRRPGYVLAVLALSIVFQVLVAAVNCALFHALGSPVGLAECVVFTSIISAVTMVPVSISGHGIREAGYAYFFGMAGVAEGAAVTASLLFFLVVAISTLPGAPLFVLGRRG